MHSCDHGSETPHTLNYCIKRLLTGMSSARQAAPNGYATAFCYLISHFTIRLSLKQLLENVHQYLTISKQDSKNVSTADIGINNIKKLYTPL